MLCLIINLCWHALPRVHILTNCFKCFAQKYILNHKNSLNKSQKLLSIFIHVIVIATLTFTTMRPIVLQVYLRKYRVVLQEIPTLPLTKTHQFKDFPPGCIVSYHQSLIFIAQMPTYFLIQFTSIRKNQYFTVDREHTYKIT